jgi:hypothetical protein
MFTDSAKFFQLWDVVDLNWFKAYVFLYRPYINFGLTSYTVFKGLHIPPAVQHLQKSAVALAS